MQPLDVFNVYFSVMVLDRPDDQIPKWLYNKLGGMPDAGLTARHIKTAFYPTSYDDWLHRRMLNLPNDYSTEDINMRGPPRVLQQVVQQCDLFKVHCLQLTAKVLSEDEAQKSLSSFNLEECHFHYRYRMFNGYFPTFKWLISPQANKKNLTR